jgi:hypothetical protein
MVQSLWKTIWIFFKNLEIELKYDPPVLLLGTYPKKLKSVFQRNVYTPVLTTALFITAKKESSQHKYMFIDKWIKNVICKTAEYYLAFSF